MEVTLPLINFKNELINGFLHDIRVPDFSFKSEQHFGDVSKSQM